MRRRVVVTGMGCVTPLGTSVPQLWANLKEGKSGVDFTTLFDASNFPTQISAEVRNWSVANDGEDAAVWEKRGRHTKFAIGAARQAVNDSGVLGTVDPDRFGVYLGAGEGQQDFYNFSHMMVAALKNGELDLAAFIQEGLKRLDPQLELEQEPNMPVAYVATHFGAEGPNFNCLTACAASSQAVGEATEIIRRGEADVMLSGGAHSMIHPFGVTGFNLLTALSENNAEPQKASRPFDLNRDGFILGEGAAVVVLEDYERAKKRGAPIYGEILGYGTTADAFRITDTHPEGRGAITCMKMALRDAQKNPADIDYINAHGTSTQVNDRVETLAIKEAVRPGRRLQSARLQHQKHDRPPDRRRRRHRADHQPDGDPRRRRPADDQLRNARPGVRPRLRPQRRPRKKGPHDPHQQLRLRRPKHRAQRA